MAWWATWLVCKLYLALYYTTYKSFVATQALYVESEQPTVFRWEKVEICLLPPSTEKMDPCWSWATSVQLFQTIFQSNTLKLVCIQVSGKRDNGTFESSSILVKISSEWHQIHTELILLSESFVSRSNCKPSGRCRRWRSAF